MEVKNELNLILNEFKENKGSHVFLIETNNITACESELKKIIINLLNADSLTKTQIYNDEYIDLIFVRPEGKNIKKDQIEELQQRLKVKPVIGDKMFFIINPADTLNEYASNKLLKTIEEPNEDVVGFLISNNISQILPTIKSRCEYIAAFYDEHACNDTVNDEIINYATDLIKLIEKNTIFDIHLYLLKNKSCVKFAKDIANIIKDYYNNACSNYSINFKNNSIITVIKESNNFNAIVRKALYLNKVLNNLNINMNTELLLEKICIDLKDVAR